MPLLTGTPHKQVTTVSATNSNGKKYPSDKVQRRDPEKHQSDEGTLCWGEKHVRSALTQGRSAPQQSTENGACRRVQIKGDFDFRAAHSFGARPAGRTGCWAPVAQNSPDRARSR